MATAHGRLMTPRKYKEPTPKDEKEPNDSESVGYDVIHDESDHDYDPDEDT